MEANENPTLIKEIRRFKITFTGTGKKFSYCSKDHKKYSVPFDRVTVRDKNEIYKIFTRSVVSPGNEVLEIDEQFIKDSTEEEMRASYDKWYDIMFKGSPGFRRCIERLK